MIVVVGAGGMGSVIARDLSSANDVTVIDSNPKALNALVGVDTFNGPINEFRGLVTADLVVTALPSDVAPDIMKYLLKKGKKVVDISFTDYNPFELDSLARSNNALYVPHAGFAPGLSNILAGWLYYSENSRDMEILVGGLQERPLPPMNYNPTFNASSVIDEYTRPARYLRNGKIETAEPLASIEKEEVKGFGELDTFYSDGLATILDTLRDATVIEKTYRYPGHLDKMKFLRDMGYFSDLKMNGSSPREISNGIFRSLAGNYRDVSILKVKSLDGKKTEFQCIDHYDVKTGTTSMARMTGYSAAAIAEGVLHGMAPEKGVFATEWIGKQKEYFDHVLYYLEERSINVVKNPV